MTVVLNQGVSASAADVVLSALLEINAVAAGEALTAQDLALGLEKLQRAIDQHNARGDLIFSHSFTLFNLIPNHAPHTIGPGGDFNAPLRPVKILSAAFVLNSTSSNPVDAPFINIRDHDWWASNPLKSLTNSIVSDLYYDPASPLGNLNFYPICNVANPVRLETWNSLNQALTAQTQLGFVQGYWEAIITDLAVRCCPAFEKSVSPDLREQWNRAMRIIEGNNDGPPRIDVTGGMPSARRGGRPDFNFLTRMRE